MASTLVSALLHGRGVNLVTIPSSACCRDVTLSSSACVTDPTILLCSPSSFQRRSLHSTFLSLERSSKRNSIPKDPLTHRRGRVSRGIKAKANDRSVSQTSDLWATGVGFKSQNSVVEGGEKTWTQSVGESSGHALFPLSPPQQDTGMFLIVLLGAYLWVRLFDYFTSKKILGQKLSRKLVHITSGLLYMLCWPFFSSSPWAPYIAGLVPLANGVRLVVYGTGIFKDEGLVKSMSRSGDSKELLRGPLYYVLVLYTSTVVFWRHSPVGMIALAMMCGGDGIADIMGRKFGSNKLFYNSDKSWAGSIAMFTFGFLVAFGCMQYFSAMGFYQLDNYSATMRLAVISLAATIVESLPVTSKLDDNFTVPVTAFVLGVLLFPM
ncbi:phytol kinase [Marchantia polymorpha subsp. ruderalis]|uniref:phytol kinase n=2 Tax=Marchantia polymorpha TaxID=3197 RepID=A0AAF6BKN2_MARPO|nr:hypothetical protein MARPO_0058s0097 [Marchantia polymorpha]BBN12566.1 hypothetical protein Mp_5g21150 [Marchantia polymorpha subsp. ruderalis]|eukprot:PTQ37326.1 hypothetical protein MARPO_0058s0097 [Marchantia polymorpha]